jgi:EmrB/QacA subfamily drug resistance transporter
MPENEPGRLTNRFALETKQSSRELMPQPLESTTRTTRLVLAATILGSSMAFLDGTVVNLALPFLQKNLGADISDVQWVVEAYALTLASLLLVGGSLGDRYGRRKIYIFGVLLFAISSLACGLAQNTAWLIVARAVQGVGGALLVPGSLALITTTFPESSRGRAIGTWSGLSAVTAAIGPVVGGWLIEHFSWRWIFFLNLPIAFAVTVLCVNIPETRDETATGSLDWLGAMFTTVGLSCITYALIGWPSGNHRMLLWIIALCGVIALAALGIVEDKAQSPMIPFSMFRSRNFTGANLLTFFVYAPLGALLFFAPLDLVQVQHYSATKAGAAFSPFVLIMVVLSRWAGRLVDRYGARLPLTLGPIITTAGYVLFALAPQDGRYWTSFFPGLLMLSLGMAITVAPLTTTVMNSVPESHAGVASGINNAVSRLASLIAVAAFGALLVMIFAAALDHRLAGLGFPSDQIAQIQSSRLQLAAIRSSDPRVLQAIADSFIHAYRFVTWIAAVSVFSAAITALLFIKPQARTLVLEPTQPQNDHRFK